nr:beta-ketoacyl synthase [uncultured bacterium]
MTRSSWCASSGSALIVGGTTPSRSAVAAVAKSNAAPPEYSRPVMVFGAVTGTPQGPNKSPMAAASTRSSSGTAAASANTTSMSAGARPASSSATSMARGRPGGRLLPGRGSVVAPCPATSAYTAASRRAATSASSNTSNAPPSPGTWPPGAGIERQVRTRRVIGSAQPTARDLGHPPPRADGSVHAAGDHQLGAAPDAPPRLRHRVEPACLVGNYHSAGATQAVADGDLTSVDRVEPGERLVRAHVMRPARRQVLQLPLPELEPAR